MTALATATTSATRVPHRRRDSRSRPRLSVPSGWLHAPPAHTGGWRTETRSCRFGSWGASAGPKIARESMTSAMTPPAQSFPFTLEHSCGETHSRVQGRVDHVHGQVREDDHHRVDEDDALDQREVAILERLQRELPDAGPREDGLDQHRPANQEAELDPDQRRGGD